MEPSYCLVHGPAGAEDAERGEGVQYVRTVW